MRKERAMTTGRLAGVAALAGLTLLSGCAGGGMAGGACTPASQRGFISGLASMSSGSGEACAQRVETTAAVEESNARAAGIRADQASARQAETGAQLRAAERRLEALNVQIRAQRDAVARLRRERGADATAQLQAQADALERERAAAARRGPTEADVQRIQRSSRELEDALRQFGAI
jgi:hypothetical protein